MSLPQGGVATGMGAQSLRQYEQAAMDSRLVTVNSTAPKLMTLDPLQNFMVKTRGRRSGWTQHTTQTDGCVAAA
jgi:hypothetical protein